jgi:uncharacterized protein
MQIKNQPCQKAYEFVRKVFLDSMEVDISPFAALPLDPAMLVIFAFPKLLDCSPTAVETALVRAIDAVRARNPKNPKKKPLEITGLETPESQMRMLQQAMNKGNKGAQSSDSATVGASIVTMMRELPAAKAILQGLASSYRAENLVVLQSLMNQLPGGSGGAVTNELLVKRNRTWLPAIERQMKKHITFVAVGAGHLPLKFGLIELLRARGYKVSAVMN